MVDEHCSLGYFDKNRIERAIDQASKTGVPVRVEVIHNERRYKVLISPALNKAKVLASRS